MSRTAASAANGDYRIEVTDFGPIEHADVRPAPAHGVRRAEQHRQVLLGDARLRAAPLLRLIATDWVPFLTLSFPHRRLRCLLAAGPRDSCYTGGMVSRGIREYVARDWGAARAAKDSYWAERIARYGPLEGFRIGDELRRQALLRDPEWPGAAARRQDLLAHVRLAELFRRASPRRG